MTELTLEKLDIIEQMKRIDMMMSDLHKISNAEEDARINKMLEKTND